MCLISEHAHALQRLKELEAQLNIEPAIPVTDLEMTSRNDYLSEMHKVGIEPIGLATPLDAQLTLTSKAELDRIAPDLVYPADLYISELEIDCEDYGIQAQCDAAFKFHVSGVRLGLGSMPLGYHGFAITMDKDKNIYWLEPNAGFPYAGVWYQIGEESYFPDKVLV
uniref:Uncharacterized protein n=1 Tax=viral metagenome TaxID=1070528 RepID=A0A6H2A2E5_9ZZZZ